jgi:redox-sensing transcriptional repressor
MGSSVSDFNLLSGNESKISERTVDRLRKYLCILDSLEIAGDYTVSSTEIARLAGVKSGLVRKDLCHFGGFGRPSVGYNISYLKKQLRNILKLNEEKHIALIGGKILQFDINLVDRLAVNNCRIDVIFTTDETKYDTDIKQLSCHPIEGISKFIKNIDIQFAIVSECGDDYQTVVDALISGGVKAILNLTQAVIKVPYGIEISNIDIPGELIALSFKCKDKSTHNTINFDIIDNDAVQAEVAHLNGANPNR